MSLDYDWIVPGLAQGSLPDPEVIWDHFDVVVFMAEEAQPDVLVLPSKKVLRAPIDDSGAPITTTEERRIQRVLPEVITAVQREKRVLVSCLAGRNRSGLVVALALVHLYPCWAADRIIKRIRARRVADSGPALTNRQFVSRIFKERERWPMAPCA
jgi:protein-tyrosine phosphatase